MLTFYSYPQSRAASILWLLEELAVPYETVTIDIHAEVPESYRAIQPNKKVPAVVHDGATITERAAIATYLCDAFPEKGLAPPIGDPRRGPYLSWLVYVDSVMDPVMVAQGHGFKYDKGKVSYGTFDDMIDHVDDTLSRQPYAVGDAFTAADTQLGTALNWGMHAMKLIPAKPSFQQYLARMAERPGFKSFMAKMQGG